MRKAYVVARSTRVPPRRAPCSSTRTDASSMRCRTRSANLPQPGWVEHDPRDILSSQLGALTELLVSHNLGPKDIDSIGITNQRETTVVWNRETGRPVGNAIVWQCRRTAPIIEELCGDPTSPASSPTRRASCPTPTSQPARSSGCSTTWAARRRRGRQAGVRHRGQLAHVVAHGRAGARHRRHERQPHHALRHPRNALGPVAARPVRHSRVPAARRAPLVGRVRRDGEPRRGARRAHPRRGGRPAGRALRPVLLRGGAGEEHVRHRLLPAHAHGVRGVPLHEPAWSRRWPPPRRARLGPSTRSRAACSWPARCCSGCATTWASSTTWPRRAPSRAA